MFACDNMPANMSSLSHLPGDAACKQLYNVESVVSRCILTSVVALMLQAIKEQNDKLRETQFRYGSSSLSQGMSAATRWQLQAWRHQNIAKQRAQLHIPELKKSVTVQLPQQDTEPQ